MLKDAVALVKFTRTTAAPDELWGVLTCAELRKQLKYNGSPF
jgi:hypothetical protein